MQKVLEPLAGSKKLENGALFYEVEESELDLLNDEKLRAEFERLKAVNEAPLEAEDEDDDTLRIALLEEMEQNSPFTADEFNQILDQELSVFKDGEKYDYVKDLKDAFKEGLSKPAAEKIFDTIPEHVFWDIKVPQVKDY